MLTIGIDKEGIADGDQGWKEQEPQVCGRSQQINNSNEWWKQQRPQQTKPLLPGLTPVAIMSTCSRRCTRVFLKKTSPPEHRGSPS